MHKIISKDIYKLLFYYFEKVAHSDPANPLNLNADLIQSPIVLEKPVPEPVLNKFPNRSEMGKNNVVLGDEEIHLPQILASLLLFDLDQMSFRTSVTRLGNFLHFGHLFKAFGNI